MQRTESEMKIGCTLQEQKSPHLSLAPVDHRSDLGSVSQLVDHLLQCVCRPCGQLGIVRTSMTLLLRSSNPHSREDS